MPRKKLIRRCEPRFGVTKAILEAEAMYVASEAEDYQRLALTELKKMLDDRQVFWRQADEALRGRISLLPERENLAIQGMIVRDVYHLYELYLTYLNVTVSEPTALVAPVPPVTKSDLPYGEWLFERKSK